MSRRSRRASGPRLRAEPLAPAASGFAVPDGSFHAKGAALLGGEAKVAIKLNANFPGNPATNGLPTVQGVIYLADASNGRPLALIDSIEITINRTGAATALAARHLARPNSRVATMCGAGVQGRVQLIGDRRRQCRSNACMSGIWIAARPRPCAQEMSAELRPRHPCRPADLATVRDSDIVVTCTSAQQRLPDTPITSGPARSSRPSAPTITTSRRSTPGAVSPRATVMVDSLEQMRRDRRPPSCAGELGRLRATTSMQPWPS